MHPYIETIFNPYLAHTNPYSKYGFLPLRIDGATSSFKAPLVVLQDRTGNCPIQTKKTTQITGAIVNLLGSYLKNWLLKCHAYPLWLFDYLQSRWRENLQHRRQLQPVENARIVSDNACFGFDCAFCPTDFTSCQYEISTSLFQGGVTLQNNFLKIISKI